MSISKTSFSAIVLICTALSAAARPDHVIAKTLYAEARSEGHKGLSAVATVIFNRGKGDYEKCIEACLKPKQFSCWNGKSDISISKNLLDQKMWVYCLQLEAQIMRGSFKPIGSWNHYAVNGTKTKWFKMMSNKTTIGAHTFGFI